MDGEWMYGFKLRDDRVLLVRELRDIEGYKFVLFRM